MNTGMLGMAAITTIPMSVALIGCSKGDSDQLSIDNDFVENIKDPNASINGIDNQIYQQAKFVSENFIKKLQQNEYNDYYEIANRWLNNATQRQIEDLLFINFNRNNNNFSILEDINQEYSVTKIIYEINNVEYDSKTHIVNFELVANINSLGQIKIIGDKWNFLKINSIAKYSIKNMKLIAKEGFNNQSPILVADTNDMNVKSTFINFKGNLKDAWNKNLEILNYAKEIGLSYNGHIIDDNYYNVLKKQWNSLKDFYYNFDANVEKTVGYIWDKDWFSFNQYYLNLYDDVLGFGVPLGIDVDGDLHKGTLKVPVFGIVEYNNDKTNFEFIIR